MTAKARTPIEVLKALRESHSESFVRTQEMLKSQKQDQQLINKALKEQPRSVPDVASSTGITSKHVLWWLAAMKKYGLVVEDGMNGDYPIYKLVEEKK
jgi:predicted Rossmann fold nucleotide-binding protein DprA/Smf involved in DNA uptake